MYNLYTNSTVSLRSKASLSLSFNDHPSYTHPSYNARCPSSSSFSSCCCNCSCCSSIPVNSVTSCRVVPINPSLTFGFRQSTLIQWPSSRIGYGAPVRDPGRTRISYGGLPCIRDAGVVRKSKGKGIGLWGYSRRVFEERLIFRKISSACEDAEAMISLLTEEVGQEFLDVRERRRETARSFQKVHFTENVSKGKSQLRKANALESVEVQQRKREGYRTTCGKEDFVKDESSRLRKQESSCSSYYSCSDSGDYESEECVEEGVMTISEQVKDERERYKNKGSRYLESCKIDDLYVGTSAKWDRRKNMKKLTEHSAEETAFRKGSVLNQSRRSEASRIEKQYSCRGEESISDMNSSEALRSRYHGTDNQVSGTSDSGVTYKHLRERSGRVDIGSSKKLNGREENVVASCVLCTTCGQVSSGKQPRSNSEQYSKISQIQENSSKLISHVETEAETRLKRMEERSGLLPKPADEMNEQHLQEHLIAPGQIDFHNYTEREDAAEINEQDTDIFRRRTRHSQVQHTDTRLASTAKQKSETRINRQEETSTLGQTSLEDVNEIIRQGNLVGTSQTDLKRKGQNPSNITDAGVSYMRKTSRTQQHEVARKKYSEENLVAFIPSQPANGEQFQATTQIGSLSQSRKASQDVSGGSQARIHETLTGNSHYKRSHFSERVKLSEQRIETHEKVHERVQQTDLRYEHQRPRREVSVREEEASNSFVSPTSQIRIEEIGEKEVDRDLMSSPSPRLAPPPQSIERDPVYATSASRLTRPVSGQSSDGDASICIYPQAIGASPSAWASGTYEEPSSLISHVDLLGSAERQDKLSLQIIGDFVDQARREASTSGTCIENKLSQRQLVNEDVTDMQMESTQSDHDNRELRKQYSMHYSGSGTTKVATDKILGLQEPPQEEESQTAATPGSVVVGRSGRTLWNVLANIARFQWGPHAESHRSPVKSGGQSSSSGSPSSEAWFSGHDPDEVQGSDMKRASSSTVPELSSSDQPLLTRTPVQSQRERFTLLNTGENAGPSVDNAPSSSSGGISEQTNIELNVDDQPSQTITSVDWSQPAAALFRRSHRRSYATIDLEEGGKEAVGSGRVDQIKDDLDSSLTEVSGAGDNAAELEPRKLLRNKQVLRERFDEWEEAYRLESEQRNIDEFFMREALEEAKKAADMWEVPVGAVLVHDGKIVARGYNLVEDLRDSTAHAEMICIREASNVLKAWRLSDTTLYVTLEPCAMCAGAILQARVGTLVYGAPNKLLGADGSWIRLFPTSIEGEASTGKPEGPVHPFHPKMIIRRGILETECADVMQQFFRLRRKKDKKTEQPDEQQSSKKLLLHPSKLLHKMHHVFHFLFCL